MTADKATFPGGYYLDNIYLNLTICLSGTQTKRGPVYPTSLYLGSGMPCKKTMRRQAHVYT